jgi:hypothetical protein
MTLPVKDERLNIKIGESDYRIQLDEERLFSTIRPLISNENRTTVGEPFAASFTMSRRIALKTQDDSPPVSLTFLLLFLIFISKITFYSKVPQFEGLAVRHMPFGSTTNLEDLRSRTLETSKSRVRERESGEPVLNKEKHKKRKSEIKTEPAATAPIVTEILETPSKPKKSKKNKKSQE